MSRRPLRSGRRRFAWAALALVMSAGCSERPPAQSRRPVVAVSVLPQAFTVRRLAGDLVDVEVMVPPGASDEAYEPTIDRLEALSKARLYVKVGHPSFSYERAWIEQLLAEQPAIEVVDASAGMRIVDEDPHLWVAPTHMRTAARNVAAALARMLPAQQEVLRINLRKFEAEIDAVDTELRATLASAGGRRFFVFHPGWGYLAREYGLQQVAIEQHGKEPDAGALARIIADAKAAGVRTIFVQPGFGRASAELVAHEIGAELAVIDPVAYEWSDNLRRVAPQLAAALVP